MPATSFSRDELSAIVHEFRHMRGEHARTSSTSVRRKDHARLVELEDRFERTLAEFVPDEDVRRAWRAHLHSGAPAPEEPQPLPQLLFRGRSEIGSEVVVRQGPDGELAREVDGGLYDRGVGLDVVADPGGARLRVGTLPEFHETFALVSDAIEALAAWAERPNGGPPWQWARELLAEGLVDRHFALTARGRRALQTRQTRAA